MPAVPTTACHQPFPLPWLFPGPFAASRVGPRNPAAPLDGRDLSQCECFPASFVHGEGGHHAHISAGNSSILATGESTRLCIFPPNVGPMGEPQLVSQWAIATCPSVLPWAQRCSHLLLFSLQFQFWLSYIIDSVVLVALLTGVVLNWVRDFWLYWKVGAVLSWAGGLQHVSLPVSLDP